MLTAWDWAEILYFDTASKENEKTDSETCSSGGCHHDRRVTNSMPLFYIKDLFSNAIFLYEFQILDLPLLSLVDCSWMSTFTLLFCKEQILVEMNISISQDMEAQGRCIPSGSISLLTTSRISRTLFPSQGGTKKLNKDGTTTLNMYGQWLC